MTRTFALSIVLLRSLACKKETTSNGPKAAATETSTTAGTEDTDLSAPTNVANPPADAKRTPSGLAYKVLNASESEKKPSLYDSVEVHYSGWTQDGNLFDSSVKRGRPATFGLRAVIPGWTEGLQLMTEGEKARLWIPAALAYGEKPARPGAPAGQLTFDVELLKIIPGPEPLPAPDDVAEVPKNATRTASGLAYRILEKGSGTEKPAAEDRVLMHYTGWTQDGTMLQTTRQQNRPRMVSLERAPLKGWVEALQLMSEGDKARVWLPASLAFGDKPPVAGAKPGPVVFDLELVKVHRAPKPIAAPGDVAKPPKSATTTASGLAYRVLKKGNGKTRPQATQRVKVHYTGWTADGKMFDSSVARGQPATFGLNQVIKGWTEGLQLMVEGEKARFWIPGKLAYGDDPVRPGAPAGQLTFDVELLEIQP